MKTSKSALLLIALVFWSGCVGPIAQTPTPPANTYQSDTIKFLGTMWTDDSRFVMRGTVLGCSGVIEPDGCNNVTISLYDKNASRLYKYDVGQLDARQNVSFSAPVRPYYVFILSQDFWQRERTDIAYYSRRNAHNFTVHVFDADDPEGLPVNIVQKNVTENIPSSKSRDV